MSILADNIRKYRNLKGLSQKELAEKLGKTKNVISNWENSLNSPDTESIEIMLGIFEIDANTLLGWDKPEQIKKDAEKLADELLSNPQIKEMLPTIISMNDDELKLIKELLEKIKK